MRTPISGTCHNSLASVRHRFRPALWTLFQPASETVIRPTQSNTNGTQRSRLRRNIRRRALEQSDDSGRPATELHRKARGDP